MTRPTLEIFIADSGNVIGIAELGGIRIGEVGPFDSRDAVLAAAVAEWPNIDHIDLPDAPDGPAAVQTDSELQHVIAKSRAARNGGFGVLSTGEKLAAALVLNRADWLESINYTMAEAIERVGAAWLARIPEAARVLEYEAEQERGDA